MADIPWAPRRRPGRRRTLRRSGRRGRLRARSRRRSRPCGWRGLTPRRPGAVSRAGRRRHRHDRAVATRRSCGSSTIRHESRRARRRIASTLAQHPDGDNATSPPRSARPPACSRPRTPHSAAYSRATARALLRSLSGPAPRPDSCAPHTRTEVLRLARSRSMSKVSASVNASGSRLAEPAKQENGFTLGDLDAVQLNLFHRATHVDWFGAS